jgi:hypothetical protein
MASGTADSDGKPLQAGKTYKLGVPKEMPAREFWITYTLPICVEKRMKARNITQL